MTVSVAVVMSVDGKLTRHDEADIHKWVSDEDQEFFRPLIASHEVIIMGRRTYEAVQPNLRLDQPTRRIVLTSRPQKFTNQVVKDKLEFRNEKSTDLVKRLKREGIKKVLIVGGPRIISELLKGKLIDFLYLTIEPRLFGQGVLLLDSFPTDIELNLVEHQQLNKKGTLLLKYRLK